MGDSHSSLCNWCSCKRDAVHIPFGLKSKSTTRSKRWSKNQFTDDMRSPTFLSRTDAVGGSSDRSSLSSAMIDSDQGQLQALASFKHELLPFFEMWDKLQRIPTDEYLAFCSLFHHHLSSHFVTHNAEAFFRHDNPTKSGEFILNQINSTIIKFGEIFAILGETQNSNVSQSVEYLTRQDTFTSISREDSLGGGIHGISTQNKAQALEWMDKFTQYYLIHRQLGVHESMFDECCHALERCLELDEVTKTMNTHDIGAFTLSIRGGLRLFFEVTRALMLQHDLSEIHNILYQNSFTQKDKLQSLITNKRLIEKFIAFWNFNIMNSMNETQKQLFSLHIYSFMVKKLQDDASTTSHNPYSMQSTIENTDDIVLESESQFEVNATQMNTDDGVMDRVYQNAPFIMEFCIGIVGWLNHLILFLEANEPKKLLVQLRNTKRRYERKGIDMNVLQPLLYAFKAACVSGVDNESLYIENRDAFHKSKLCLLDEEMEECVDFVFNLFMQELMPSRTITETQSTNFNHSSFLLSPAQQQQILKSSDDIFSTDHDLMYNSPIASPQNKLNHNVNSSLSFWNSNIRLESAANIRKLSDKIFEKISLVGNTELKDVIWHLSSRIDRNVNVIELMDAFIFKKIDKYSRNIDRGGIRFNFNEDVDANSNDQSLNQNNTKFKQKMKYRVLTEEISKSADMDMVRVTVDFVSLRNDAELTKLATFITKYEVSADVFKLLRNAIIDVLQSYYPSTFDNVTKRNFTLLLRTITSLMLFTEC
eukprot:165994_1